MTSPRVQSLRRVGDSALAAEFEPRLDVEINRAAAALGAAVRAAALHGVRDVVVTTHAVTACVDPLAVDWAALATALETPVDLPPEPPDLEAPIVIPVAYGGAHGPDLDDVARTCSCRPEDVIAWHAARTYRVFMVGFMPGFGYLGIVDERIRVPRRDAPRVRVPAGTIAIAGALTSIYPGDTPGGWSLIGRTAWRAFDLDREPPCLLEVGRSVRFEIQ